MLKAISELALIQVTSKGLEYAISIHLSLCKVALVNVSVLELKTALAIEISCDRRQYLLVRLDLLRSCRLTTFEMCLH